MKKLLTLCIGCLLLTACVSLSPLTDKEKMVKSVANNGSYVSVFRGMVFYDSRPPTRGLRYPEGKYVLEAEDEDYFYYKSPNPLELRMLKNGESYDQRNFSGGLMVSKSDFSLAPGGGYLDISEGKKLQFWKHGKELLRLEGKEWERK